MGDTDLSYDELKHKFERLQQEMHWKNESWAQKNRELDALHYVWCTGGCTHGVHRYQEEPLTGAIVAEAEKQAKRLRSYWNTVCFRKGVACVCGHDVPSHFNSVEKDVKRWGICDLCPCPHYTAPTEEPHV